MWKRKKELLESEAFIEDEFRKAQLPLQVSYNSKDNETVLSMVKGKLGVTIIMKNLFKLTRALLQEGVKPFSCSTNAAV